MSWMQFSLELLDRLLWPAITLLVLFSLRKPLHLLLPQTRSFKYKDLELEFGDSLQQASQHAEGAFPELKQDRRGELQLKAENNPKLAVMAAWELLFDKALALLERSDVDAELDHSTRYKMLGQILGGDNIVDNNKAALYHELRQLRNRAAHAKSFQISLSEALKYIELCFKLGEYFDSLYANNQNISQLSSCSKQTANKPYS
ncbi:hypothetical protein [Agaribacterium haliotis]|uniref:hypothetical protein n=1 Tax=Agaribacterium haliotis TaxID=2013869 RepID=UPI000BB5304B|nr:hypothetical protein [Agaribacterium haliotis]